MENVGKFYGHLVDFMVMWYNVWPFGVVCGPLVYFPRFGMFGPRKLWQPWFEFLPGLSVLSLIRLNAVV
jgi:hypothetical protein